MLEKIIIILIVSSAAAFAGWVFSKNLKKKKGCEGCNSTSCPLSKDEDTDRLE